LNVAGHSPEQRVSEVFNTLFENGSIAEHRHPPPPAAGIN